MISENNFFANRLRSLRQSNGLTQKAVGEIIGVKTQVINDMEHGRCKTSIDRAIALAEHFKVSVDYLLGLVDDPSPENHEFAAFKNLG